MLFLHLLASNRTKANKPKNGRDHLVVNNTISVIQLKQLGSYNNGCQFVTQSQARREPQWGPGKHFCGAPKHFYGAALKRKFLNISFQNGAFWRTFFLADSGDPQTSRGPK